MYGPTSDIGMFTLYQLYSFLIRVEKAVVPNIRQHAFRVSALIVCPIYANRTFNPFLAGPAASSGVEAY